MQKIRAVGRSSRIGYRWVQAAALALLLTFAAPGWAGDERAVKTRVPPVYPELAKRMRVSGEVKLEVTVDADGKVKAAKAVSGNHILGEAAEEAVRKWKFESGSGDATVVVAVNFALSE